MSGTVGVVDIYCCVTNIPKLSGLAHNSNCHLSFMGGEKQEGPGWAGLSQGFAFQCLFQLPYRMAASGRVDSFHEAEGF